MVKEEEMRKEEANEHDERRERREDVSCRRWVC